MLTDYIPDTSARDRLPEYWPDDPPPKPLTPYWIPWPIAVLAVPLLWVMPKRFGPHFAGVSWWGAIFAHLIWLPYGIGCMMLVEDYFEYSLFSYVTGNMPPVSLTPGPLPDNLVVVLRAPFAAIAVTLSEEIRFGTTGFGASDLLAGLGAVLGLETILLLLLTIGLMPYAAYGESRGRLFLRCFKMVLWTSTVAVPIGLLYQVSVGCLTDQFDSVSTFEGVTWAVFPQRASQGAGEMAVAKSVASGIGLAFLVWVWIRSALRPAGPAKGPAWEPRCPQCEKCGYRLTGLARQDRCPECGLPVQESLPGSRRPTAFAAATGWFPVYAYLRTFMAVAFRRDFAATLAMRHQHRSARTFGFWTIALMAIGLTMMGAKGDWREGELLSSMAGLFIFVCFVLGIAPLTVSSKKGGASNDVSTLAFYLTPTLFVVGGITVGAVLFADYHGIPSRRTRWLLQLPYLNSRLDLRLFPIAAMIGLSWCLMFRRWYRAFRQTRYANA